MQQCGRTTYIEFETYKSVESYLEHFPKTKIFDFTQKSLRCDEVVQSVLIGCEGGFSPREREIFKSYDVFSLNTPLVLRSESAAFAVASKILL
jgi:16S rRNA (uracil1498-N3)-methyltransferase